MAPFDYRTKFAKRGGVAPFRVKAYHINGAAPKIGNNEILVRNKMIPVEKLRRYPSRNRK